MIGISFTLLVLQYGILGLLIYDLENQNPPDLYPENNYDYELEFHGDPTNATALIDELISLKLLDSTLNFKENDKTDFFWAYDVLLNSSINSGSKQDRELLLAKVIFFDFKTPLPDLNSATNFHIIYPNDEISELFTQNNISKVRILPNDKANDNITQVDESFGLSVSIESNITLNNLTFYQKDLLDSAAYKDFILLIAPFENFFDFIEGINYEGWENISTITFALKLDIEIYNRILWTFRGRDEWRNFKHKIEGILQKSSFLVVRSVNIIDEMINSIETNYSIIFLFRLVLLICVSSIGLSYLWSFLKKQHEELRVNEILFTDMGLSFRYFCIYYFVERSVIVIISIIFSFIGFALTYQINWPEGSILNDIDILMMYPNNCFLASTLTLIVIVLCFSDLKTLMTLKKEKISDLNNPFYSALSTIKRQFSGVSSRILVIIFSIVLFTLTILNVLPIFDLVLIFLVFFVIFAMWYFIDVIEHMKLPRIIFSAVARIFNINKEFLDILRRLYSKCYIDIMKFTFILMIICISFFSIVIGMKDAYEESTYFNRGGNIVIETQSEVDSRLISELKKIKDIKTIGYATILSGSRLIEDEIIIKQDFDIIGIGTDEYSIDHFYSFNKYIQMSLTYDGFFSCLKNRTNVILSKELYNYRKENIGGIFKIRVQGENTSNILSYNFTIKGYIERFPDLIGEFNPIKQADDKSSGSLIIVSSDSLKELLLFRSVELITKYYISVYNDANQVAEQIKNDFNIIPKVTTYDMSLFNAIFDIPMKISIMAILTIIGLILLLNLTSFPRNLRVINNFLKAYNIDKKERRAVSIGFYVYFIILISFGILISFIIYNFINNFFINISYKNLLSHLDLIIIFNIIALTVFSITILHVEVLSVHFSKKFEKEGVSSLLEGTNYDQ